jgi:two-component system LytT family sensor kinase
MDLSSINLGVPPEPPGPASDIGLLRRHRSRAVVWMTLMFWVSNYGLLTLATGLSGVGHLAQVIPIRLGELVLGLGFCFAIHLILRRLPTTKKRLIALAFMAPIAAETFAWAVFFAEATIYPELNLRNFTWAAAVRTISFWSWFFLAWAGTYLAVSYSFDVREEQQRSAEITERAHLAQLRALHSQINPHFLFNSLNSVSALILDRKPDQAEEMVSRLSRFLRMGLMTDPGKRIPLTSEVELQCAYLAIEQIRYDDLRVDISMPDELAGVLVPSLILQPIVENAVKYGVAGAPPPSTIAIDAAAEADKLVLTVRDSGKGGCHGSKGAGIGLANIRQRLLLIYGGKRTDLTTGRLPDGSFQVRLTLPLEAE